MTPKIVQTVEHQLAVARAIIERQAAEIRELRLALSHLASRVKKQPVVNKYTPLLRKAPCSSEHDSGHRPQTEEFPSFARSTRASRLRHSTSPASSQTSTPATDDSSSSVSLDSAGTDPQRVVIHGKPYIYKNGKLTPSGFGYLLSTKATINRFGNNERRREEDCRILRASSPDALEWFGHEAMTEPVTAVSNEVAQPEEPAQVVSEADLEDRSERKRIEIQTRLGDNAWLSDPVNNICLDDDEVFDILYRGEKVAKRCLWRWLRINRPMTSRRFGYLSNMDFGRDTLSRFYRSNRTVFDYRHTQSVEVEYIMEHLIWLRNSVHHFDGWGSSLAVVEEHLFAVHRLAVLLYDEEIAVRARSLRDRLHQAAEGVAQEIETVWLLTELPFAGDHPWKHHHITLFREVLETRRSDEDWARQKYSPAAFEGAVEFGQRIHVNDMSWDCGPDMEEAWPRFRDWRAVGVDVLINVAQKISRAVLVARLFLIV